MSHAFPQPPADLPPDLMMDFDREARRLHAALGLDGRSSRTYNDMDKIWVDQKTGGAIWVGNEVAAKGPLEEFEEQNIDAVVNCTDDMPNYLEGAGPIYYRFNVAYHSQHSADPSSLATFVGKLFVFVDAALAAGRSVLVHCLAGAHRAGTTGVLLLMYKEGLSAEAAVAAAQARRPIINPIGQLPLLLRRYEALREEQHAEVWAEAEAARQAQDSRISKRQTEREGESRAAAGGPSIWKAGRPPAAQAMGRDQAEAARASAAIERARASSLERTRTEAHQRARAASLAAAESEERARLEACMSALGAIGRRADLVYAHAHSFRLAAEEEAQMALERGWLDSRALAMRAGEEEESEEDSDEYYEEYEDDFEEDDEEETSPYSQRRHDEDLAALRAAVEESRSAVKAVEQRLLTAETQEAERQDSSSKIAFLAASVSNALGVSREAAERALEYCHGDLEKAVALLAQRRPIV